MTANDIVSVEEGLPPARARALPLSRNALQSKFLDIHFAAAVGLWPERRAIWQRLANDKVNDEIDRSGRVNDVLTRKELHESLVTQHPPDDTMAGPGTPWLEIVESCRVGFEVHDADVALATSNAAASPLILINVAPTLGGDYPKLLRRMMKIHRKPGKAHPPLRLVYQDFFGQEIEEKTMRDVLFASGVVAVRLAQLEEAARRMFPAAPAVTNGQG
jgi:hypothetical protein